MRSILPGTILFFMLLTGTFVKGQVKFSASVSSNEISKNELVQLKLMVENAQEVQQITPPAFKNFIVVSGPNQESGMTMINGDVKRYIALSYVLKPKGPGSFNIAAATAKADGKILRSNSVSVKVSNSVAANNSTANNSPFPGIDPYESPYPTALSDNVLRKGESAEEKINKNMFLKLDLDKTSCYVGEPVIATYKLYTRLRSESNLVKNPSFNGFSVIDLQQPSNTSYTREKVNGREYNVYILRKAQLYPLQAGELELEPAELENNIAFIKEAYVNRQNSLPGGMFSEFDSNIPADGIENRRLTLRSRPVTITVKQLPVANTPASFTGAVGRFAIETGLEKDIFSTDDAGKLRLIIKGEGNLQLVNNPEMIWPQGFEAFEPTASDDFIKTNVPVSGRKIIDYPFTVSKPGNYILPAIKFSYFDAEEGKYKTDSSQPISFTVTQGTGKKINATLITKAENISGLQQFFNNRRLVVSTVAVLILLGLIFWLKKDKKKEIRITQIKIAAEAAAALEKQKIAEAAVIEEKNWLEKTGTLMEGNSSTFYSELNHALKSYLSSKLKLPIETINKKNIIEELDKKNITVDTVVQLQQLMNEIELQLYTPFPQKEKMQELYDDTADMIQLLDTYKDQASVNL